jgi:uncharacterized protein (TIGR03435 family)
MMSSVGELAVAIGNSPGLSLIVKATLVSAAALGAARIARRSRAAVRHVLFATAFLVLLMLPLVSALVPVHRVTVPIPDPDRLIGVAPPPPEAAQTVLQSVDGGRFSGIPSPRPSPSMSRLVVTVWLLGVMVCLVPVAAGLLRVRRVHQNGQPWRDGQAAVAEIAALSPIRLDIRVMLHDEAVGPMTCGVVRPSIVVPRDALQWTAEELQRAIVHELEHVRRADWLTLCIARSICACYWFHPLVWMLWRHLRLEAERACDDAVLRNAEPEIYAEQLVALAARLASDRAESGLAMANRSDLSARVEALLDGRQVRGRAGAWCVATASMAAVLLSIAVAPLRAVAVPQEPDAPGGNRPTFDVASVKSNTSGAQELSARVMPGGRFVANNMPLRQLIRYAYELQESELIGGTREQLSQRFDINARGAEEASVADIRLMLQSLLEERFRLRTHSETRTLPVYYLEPFRPGADITTHLRPSGAQCDGASLAEIGAANADPLRPCGYLGPAPGATLASGRSRMALRGLAMPHFARLLEGPVRRRVIDGTGLSGLYDADFDFTIELGPPPPPPEVADPLDRTSLPSLFTILPEQLGLRLRAADGPVRVLLIDDIQLPSDAQGASETRP